MGSDGGDHAGVISAVPGGERIGQGRERAMERLRANPEAPQRLVEAIECGAAAPGAQVAAVAEQLREAGAVALLPDPR